MGGRLSHHVAALGMSDEARAPGPADDRAAMDAGAERDATRAGFGGCAGRWLCCLANQIMRGVKGRVEMWFPSFRTGEGWNEPPLKTSL